MIKYDSEQTVTYVVKYIPDQLEFLANFVYSFNQKDKSKVLWNYIRMVRHVCGLLWIVVEDFNVVLKSDNRMGGS